MREKFIDIGRWYINLNIDDERSIGIGWWTRSAKWFFWMRTYYDGNWFAVRVGPFYYTRGPY